MGGFDNGTLQGGIFAQAKQFGSVLRGYGPPVPALGVVGDVYLDVQTFFLYEKTSANSVDTWGNYLFQVPEVFRSTLKWFSAFPPTNDFGYIGDYCLLWGGFPNYGLSPPIFGPKQAYGWSEIGVGPDTDIDPQYAGFELPVGLVDEGNPTAFSGSTQLIVVGVNSEYILARPVELRVADTPVSQIGFSSTPMPTEIDLNPIYTATDVHTV